jgi:hypothetical protein
MPCITCELTLRTTSANRPKKFKDEEDKNSVIKHRPSAEQANPRPAPAGWDFSNFINVIAATEPQSTIDA